MISNEELLKRIENLERQIELLRASATIPFEIEKAFVSRLGNTFASGGIETSVKSNTSESIPVNTAAGTNVQLFPDLFLQTTIGGVTYYIAAYT